MSADHKTDNVTDNKTDMTADKSAARGKHPIRRIILILLAVVILGGVIYLAVYLNSYNRARPEAFSVLNEHPSSVTIVETRGKRIDFIPEDPVCGFIFYPGGLVEYESYAPLMEKLAENGILCVLLHMPGNLAVMGSEKAAKIPADYPEITAWYIGGHSLGGCMAAFYTAKHPEDVEGLILLAAYSTKDLTDAGVPVLSIYGTNDGVMDMDAYRNEHFHNLPQDLEEHIIEGGIHAYFGAYEFPEDQEIPGITPEEQLSQTAAFITEFIR